MAADVEPAAVGEICRAGFTMAVSPMVCGEFGASSVMTTIAARAPTVLGASETLIAQVAPTAYAGAVQLLDKVKSAALVPPSATELMWSGPVPELVSVVACGGTIVACVTPPKET